VALSQVRFPIRVRRADQSYQTSYLSSVDGSAQVYAVQPAQPAGGSARPGLVLSLHGAGVQAMGQADSYAPKPWAHVVAPTNRRPFGFDWEDWGRIDALEVLDHASERLQADPERVHLTGHSMGGHGTWQLGVHATDRFAAVAPSAGWCDFWTYTGAWQADPDSAVEQMLARAANASRTALALENLASRGVYVLHGDADDNVPVREARAMRERLGAFHPDFAYYERPGAGHWWGAPCVDWPPLVDFLEARRVPRDADRLQLSFTTVDPGVSSRLHWVVVEAQHRSLEPSRVEAALAPDARRFTLQTTNVSRLLLDLTDLASGDEPCLPGGQALTLQVDGQDVSIPWPQAQPAVRLLRAQPDGPWQPLAEAPPSWKGPQRAGPLKAAFAREVLLVYGTSGTAEESAWSVARARLDLDTWAYRGNGTAQLLSDEAFLAMQPHWRGQRNAVIYGHAGMNRAWTTLDPACPLEVRRGSVRVGTRTLERDDLAVLFTYPRRESPQAAAAVICASGPVGQRLSEHLSTFTSGVAWPDWAVVAPEMLAQGGAGALGAGFFGYDWTLERGQSAWQPGL
jgi:dienelactone hydrolase